MDNMVINENVLERYTGDEKEVSVPFGVTTIGYHAFHNCNELHTVILPETVTAINYSAFSNCSFLETVVFPKSLIEIEEEAFHSCKCLRNIHFSLPSNLKRIGQSAFWDCSSLESVSLPDSISEICADAFRYCQNLTSIVLPANLTKLGPRAFSGCQQLRNFILPENSFKINTPIWGPEFPEGLLDKVGILYQRTTDQYVESTFLDKTVWSKLPIEMQADIFLDSQGRKLSDGFKRCITAKSIKPLADEILKRLEANASPTLIKRAEAFVKLYGEKVPETLKTRIKELNHAGAKVSSTTKPSSAAKKETTLSSSKKKPAAEQMVAEYMNADKKTAANLKAEFKKYYSIDAASLPAIYAKDGSKLTTAVLLWLLFEHEEPVAYEKNALGPKHIIGLTERAAAVVAELDAEKFQKALLKLADDHLGHKGVNKGRFLASPICRYADAALTAELTKRAPSWRTTANGINSPSLVAFRWGILFNDTHAAMLFADQMGDLNRYAAARKMNAEVLRDKCLADVGLDANGQKAFDLGNQKVIVELQPDLSFIVVLPDGKTAKSLPKKDADTELYSAANAAFTELKKNVKKIVKNRQKNLQQDFLTGKEYDAAHWNAAYLPNPLLRKVASLLVWQQGQNTFTISNGALITEDEKEYVLKADSKLKLAHPMELEASVIQKWQAYFVKHGLKQPFEQVWEPVMNKTPISQNRYKGIMIPYYHFHEKTHHGIKVEDAYFHQHVSISFEDCSAEVERIDYHRHELNPDDRFEITSFTFKKYTRKVNHIVAYLDKITINERLLKDDSSIGPLLSSFTLAQISEFIQLAAENKCVNVTAVLLEHKNRHFPNLDPLDSFVLD